MTWMDHAGRLVDAIGTPGFAPALADGLRAIAGHDFTVIFGYVGSARPLDLYDDFPPDRRRLHVEEYQEGPYLLDPFFLITLDLPEPGLWRMAEIAPDRFYQGEYFRNYYTHTGLAEEIGYIFPVTEELTVVISLMRKERRFSRTEIRALKQVWPLIRAAGRQNWRDVVLTAENRAEDIAARVVGAFQRIGAGVLTPRERQIVELTLRGHSADAIGQRLQIASGTVRIHRRNIYAKLRISSQGELFSIFINAMIEGTGRAPKA